MTIKLIASDMDGTFLKTDNDYDVAAFLTLMEKLQQQDIRFVAASGRQLSSLQALFAPVVAAGYDIDYVASNGAVVAAHDQELYAVHLSQAQLATVIAWHETSPLAANSTMVIIGEAHPYLVKAVRNEQAETIYKFYPDVAQVPNIAAITERILGVTFLWSDDDVDQHVASLQATLGDDFHITGSGFGTVDVLNAGVDKATGLQILQDYYNALDSDVVVFGDNANDLEMLQKFEQAFVMPNAAPIIRQQVTKKAVASNQANGVIQTIDYLLQDRV